MDGAIIFFESLDYENEHFEGFCTLWTIKVDLKCCCEKANIDFWAILLGIGDGSRLWVGFTRLNNLAF